MSIKDMKQEAEAQIEATLEKLWSAGYNVFRIHITNQDEEPPVVSIIFDNGRGQG